MKEPSSGLARTGRSEEARRGNLICEVTVCKVAVCEAGESIRESVRRGRRQAHESPLIFARQRARRRQCDLLLRRTHEYSVFLDFLLRSLNVGDLRLKRAQFRHIALNPVRTKTNVGNKGLDIERHPKFARIPGPRQCARVPRLTGEARNGLACNQSQGAGDQLLCLVGARLLHALRTSDMAARLGGDEFGVVLSDTCDPASAALVADKILGAMREPFSIRGLNLRVTAQGREVVPCRPSDGGAPFVLPCS